MTLEPSGSTKLLAGFLKFVSEARSCLQQNRVSEQHPDVKRIRSGVEENYRDDRGRPAIFQKYESSFYGDASAMVTLWDFFGNYDRDLLCRYQTLTAMELSGLRGDQNPNAILGRSVLGMAGLLFSALTVWWGVIAWVSREDSGNLLAELLKGLLSPAMANRLVGMIWLVGLGVVIWYALRMIRNRKQVAFLSSLSRALELYRLDSKTSK
ncbi:MAG: hypothetical protein DRQ60_11325 [Gammaproteobacteria bacterium]|nr:MAG: hypothetical protein DRQ54_04835 [Gammaproteobacteria bacterium]RLA10384.1 MAG: hypothetical protein DRQ60_11325 [Gammaproteobacteria bacterium]RLA13735.1 MAG: hypothetical protein DRQ52_05675 [Gammaproteobacteria bacterium]